MTHDIDLIPTVDITIGDETWRAFSFLFPTDNISHIVFGRVTLAGKELDAGAFTAIRTVTQVADKREWWISGIDATDGKLLAAVDWWPGEPHLPDPDLVQLLVERRAAKALEATLRNRTLTEVVHYGERGAHMHRGGRVVPFIGRG